MDTGKINQVTRLGGIRISLLERPIVFLLISLVFSVTLGVRYTSPDDMGFYLGAHGDVFGYALEHAKSSGRIWLIITEPLEYIFLNTIYSTYLITLSNILVTYALYELLIRLYGNKIAGIWAIIYLAIVPIGWWFNVLVAYPAFYFGLGISCLSFILLLKAIKMNNNFYLSLSIVLYIFSLINYELVTIFSSIITLVVYRTNANDDRLKPYFFIVCVYLYYYLIWITSYKTSYTGIQYAQASIFNIWQLNIKYFLSAFSIYSPTEFFQGYSLVFNSAIDGVQQGFAFNLSLKIIIRYYLDNYFELFKLLFFIASSSFIIFCKDNNHNNKNRLLNLLPILLYVGFVAPFIFSAKYQDWFLNVNVPSYTNSVFISISLALFVSILLKNNLKNKFIKVIAFLSIVILYSLSDYYRVINSENIMKDNIRWRVVDKIFETKILRTRILSLEEVYAPTLWSFGWMNSFQYKPDQYWQLYTERMHGKKLNLINSQEKKTYHVFDYIDGNVLLLYRLNKVDGFIDDFIIAFPKDYSLLLNNDKVIEKNCHSSICEFYVGKKLDLPINIKINEVNHAIRIK